MMMVVLVKCIPTQYLLSESIAVISNMSRYGIAKNKFDRTTEITSSIRSVSWQVDKKERKRKKNFKGGSATPSINKVFGWRQSTLIVTFAYLSSWQDPPIKES